ncbi:ATP phosphoribosyltransferase regulatory subunit, partial [Candidatus Woesearchaeota archaeon]|nr:ATP phosphoribosyltransferase regulatory subunit [Candidatus Woesearchaeota archaeon]
MKLETAKGVRDFPPEEKIVRNKVVDTLKDVFESYGYNPFETPIIERLDVLTSKFGAGEESDAYNEIFKFKDQGNRDLGLRFELTLSLCRFIAMNPNIKLPFKRYEIGRVYRDGPIKLGRTREFYQCDVDVVGSASMMADAEILAIASEVFRRLEMPITIEVSNRKLLNGILTQAGVPENLKQPAMIAIDKLKKFGIKTVTKELEQKGISKQSITKIESVLKIQGTTQEKLAILRQQITNKQGIEGLTELKELFNYLNILKVTDYEFNPTLA